MKKQLVHIKGTKDGLILRMDDQCAYADLVEELERKVSEGGIDGKVEVQLHLGYRYCHEEQLKELVRIIQQSGQMLVSKVQSEVITVEESNRRLVDKQCEMHVGIVRSGQIVRSKGDLIVIGNVNQNGRVEATGNIFVLGKLKGIAHAGVAGNKEAIVAAAILEPTHILIADLIETMANESRNGQHSRRLLTCAFIDNNGQMAYNRIQALKSIRPIFNITKGGS